MSPGPRQSGSVDPDDLGRREFSKSRKGWDPVEVRAHLLTMAGEIKRLQSLEFEYETKVEGLETELARHANLDEGLLTQMLGEETARVLEAARSASVEIKAKAEERSNRVVEEAEQRAAAITRDAEELRLAASREADELIGEARARADELLGDARHAADELRSNAEADAATTRERADRVLADRTTEAEAEAERVRHAAQSTREDADAYAERARADADAEAARKAEEAAAASASEVEEAREQGRRMVQEAKDARERMLRDLAERRRTARQQLEALRAGRERLLEAFGSARAAFDDATDELTDALPAARAAADAAAKEVDDDLDAAVAEIEAELSDDSELEPTDAPSSGTDEIERGGDATDVGADTDADFEALEPEDEVVVVAAEDESEPGNTRLRLVANPDSSDDTSDIDDDDEADDEGDDGEGDDEGDDGEGDDDESTGSVEAIFARLRANQPEDDEPVDEDDESSDDDQVTAGDDAVVIDLASEIADRPDADVAPTLSLAGDDVVTEMVEAAIDAEVSLLDRRDDALEEIEKQTTRRLKRVLSDQENALLDRLQRGRKAKLNLDVLEDEAKSRETLWKAVTESLSEAAGAGSIFFDDDDHRGPVDESAEIEELHGAFDEWVSAPLRERLERTIGETDERSEAPDRLRAAYREWKNDRLPDLAGDLVSAAFNRGILASATESATHGWIVDHGGLPCPDCDDNHLAGQVKVGDEFPTGHVAPPAQPGCRCLLVSTRG